MEPLWAHRRRRRRWSHRSAVSGSCMEILRPFRSIAAIAFVFALGHRNADAASLRKVWELDLRTVIDAKVGSSALPVFALRFSPNGKELAVVADVYGSAGQEKSRLM